jgi:hypothetical protein
MKMNKEAIEKRIAELRNNLEQVTAQGNGIVGAIQDCEYWISQLIHPEAGKVEETKP